MTDRLALPRRYRDQLEALLREHVPGVEVWAYGSRVNGVSHEGSDLDLVLRGPALEPLEGGFYDLLEAIEKSNIPILVQAHNWAMLPESFHREIELDYVVVQKGSSEDSKDLTGQWREMTLGDVCTKIGSGATPRGGRDVYVQDGPYTLIRSQNVYNDGFHRDGLVFIGDYYADELKNVEVFEEDVLLNITGDSVARVCQVASDVLPARVNQHVAIIRPDSFNLDPGYLRYFLVSPEMQTMLLSWAGSGGTRNALTKGMIESLEIPLPPLPEQRAIAHVLGTLDDKIELNRRMNETLEAMARALFKSWFVDFDPVRAKMDGRWRDGESLPGLPAEYYDLFPDRLVDSELGDVPEGWEVRALSSFGKIVTGKTPSTRNSTFYGTDVPFLRIPDMHGRMYAVTTGSMLSTNGSTSQSRQALPSGSVSVSCIATPGLVILNHRKTHTNQQINSIVPNDIRASKYLYWSCRQMASEIMTGGSGGSVFHNMNKSTFSALGILDAHMRAIGAFENQVSSLHKMILANEKQSQNLTALREGLLPKLVSGDVRVGEVV